MPAIVLPASEIVLVAWARTVSSITTLVATDPDTGAYAIATSLPKTGDLPIPLPFLTFASDPGSIDIFSGENIPIIDNFLQVDAFANTKPEASTLIQTVLAEIRVLHEDSAASRRFAGAFIHGGRLLVGPRPFIERDHVYTRFSMDIGVTIGPEIEIPAPP